MRWPSGLNVALVTMPSGLLISPTASPVEILPDAGCLSADAVVGAAPVGAEPRAYQCVMVTYPRPGCLVARPPAARSSANAVMMRLHVVANAALDTPRSCPLSSTILAGRDVPEWSSPDAVTFCLRSE